MWPSLSRPGVPFIQHHKTYRTPGRISNQIRLSSQSPMAIANDPGHQSRSGTRTRIGNAYHHHQSLVISARPLLSFLIRTHPPAFEPQVAAYNTPTAAAPKPPSPLPPLEPALPGGVPPLGRIGMCKTLRRSLLVWSDYTPCSLGIFRMICGSPNAEVVEVHQSHSKPYSSPSINGMLQRAVNHQMES